VHPSADVEARALDLALRIAAKDRANLSLLKRTLTLPRRRRLEEALTLESLMHESSLARFDSREMGGAP
jgi:enoyl-CoA hydratase/carnithine racemase